MHSLRIFFNERLAAAAEEIFEAVEKTIAEYKEEICRSKDLEIGRLRMQLQLLKSGWYSKQLPRFTKVFERLNRGTCLRCCIWVATQGPAWKGASKPGWSSITITPISSHPLRSINLSLRSPSIVRRERGRRRAAAGWSTSTR